MGLAVDIALVIAMQKNLFGECGKKYSDIMFKTLKRVKSRLSFGIF